MNYTHDLVPGTWGTGISEMDPVEPAHIRCPYCGERLEIIVDSSVRRQEYIEDCQVCCKPISLSICMSDEGQPSIEVRSQDE